MNLKSVFLYIFSSNILVAITSIVTGLLTARFLGVDDRGGYYLIVQATSIASVVFSLGVAQSLQFHIRAGQMTISQGLRVSLCITGALLAVFIALTPVLQSDGSVLRYYKIAAAIIALLVLNLYISAILMTEQKGVEFVSKVNILSAILTSMCVIAYISQDHLTVGSGLFAIVIGNLAKSLLLLAYLKGHLRSALFGIIEILVPPKFINYAFTSVGFASVFVIFSKADIVLATYFMDSFESGNYSLVLAFSEAPILLGAALGAAMFAKLPAESDLTIRNTTVKIALIVAPTSILTCLLIYYFMEYALLFLVGDSYALVSTMFLKVIPGLVAIVIAYIFANFHAVRAEQHISLAIFLFGFIVKVGCLYLAHKFLAKSWLSIIWSYNVSGVLVLTAFMLTFINFSGRASCRSA